MYGKKKKVDFSVLPPVPYRRPPPVDLDEEELRKYGLETKPITSITPIASNTLNSIRTAKTSSSSLCFGQLFTFFHFVVFSLVKYKLAEFEWTL